MKTKTTQPFITYLYSLASQENRGGEKSDGKKGEIHYRRFQRQLVNQGRQTKRHGLAVVQPHQHQHQQHEQKEDRFQ